MMRAIMGKLGGEGFSSRNMPLIVLAKCFIVQKIFRINGRATWPVHWTSAVKAPERIKRGTRFPGLSMGCHIDGRNGIHIGENVWIGPRVSLISMNHDMSDFERYEEAGPIVIGRNSWIASNAVILPTVILGEHTVVAAGSVVTKSFLEGNQLLAGAPARVIRALGPYEGRQDS